ncbi:hypothetical protein ABZ590_24100, partial [Streptomyces hirsutus]
LDGMGDCLTMAADKFEQIDDELAEAAPARPAPPRCTPAGNVVEYRLTAPPFPAPCARPRTAGISLSPR